jgi:heme A synthase
LSGLFIAFVLCVTVILVLALGILTAYTAVNAILYAFGHQNRSRAAVVLIPSQTHAGD